MTKKCSFSTVTKYVRGTTEYCKRHGGGSRCPNCDTRSGCT